MYHESYCRKGTEQHMQPQKSLICRILAVWLAVSFLPALFFVNPVQENEKHSPDYFGQESCIPHPELGRFVTLICTEEFLPQRTDRIYRHNSPRSLTRLKNFHPFFRGKIFLFISVCILCVGMCFLGKAVTYTQKYIIRYIQNQDGRKGCTPFQFIRNLKTEVQNYAYSCYCHADDFGCVPDCLVRH